MAKGVPALLLALLAVVLFFGVQRLQHGKPPSIPEKWAQRDAAGACLPQVELPAATPVSLQLRAAPAAPRDGAARARAPAQASLQVFTRAPLAVDLPDAGEDGKAVSVAGRTLRIDRTHGTFELELSTAQGSDVMVRRGSAAFRLQEPARFAPAAEATYKVRVTKDVQATFRAADRKFVIPANTVLGEVALDQVQAATTVQPLLLRNWLTETALPLTPTRVVGQAGLADVAVDFKAIAPGLDATRVSQVACAWVEGLDRWLPAGVTQQVNGGKAKLSLPGEVLPSGMRWTPMPVYLAVASADGAYAALGGLHMMAHGAAAVIATAFTLVLLGLVMYARGRRVKDGRDRPRWFSGLFLGAEGTPSLSLLQVFIWTIITIWGFAYVYVVAGDLLSLTEEMMWLLGIAGTGTVLARWIGSSQGGPVPTDAAGVTRTAGGDCDTDFWTMLQTDGRFDLLKLQLFAFTVVIALYVVFRIADAAAFPQLDTNTLLLLGVSQGVYITGKLAQKTDLSSAWSVRAQLNVLAEQKPVLERKLQAARDLLTKAQAANPADPSAVAKAETAVAEAEKELKANADKAGELQADYARKLEALGLRPL